MECPKCNYVRQEKDSIVPDWQCPECGVAYTKAKTTQDKFVQLVMVSGHEIRLKR
jgi:ribosomal protein L37AE/L43A